MVEGLEVLTPNLAFEPSKTKPDSPFKRLVVSVPVITLLFALPPTKFSILDFCIDALAFMSALTIVPAAILSDVTVPSCILAVSYTHLTLPTKA